MSELIDIATFKELSDNLDNESLDLGVSIHRTNPLPLDSSSLVWLEDWLEDPSSIKTEDIFREKAWEAVQSKIEADPTSYPGQCLTVLGRVYSTDEDGNVVDSVDKAISFIIQGKDHSHQDYNINSETDTLYTQPHNVTVQELAYKSYVDKLTVELQDQIGNLTSVMNFRGVVKTFNEVTSPQLGDLIIITEGATPGTTTVEKPGMEYVYTENGWTELGFGSQVITFINGTDGLSIPKTAFATTDEKISSLLDYIKHSDKTLAKFIGVLTSNDELKLPAVLNSITKEATSEDTETLIKYLQSADESVINFIYNLLGIDESTFDNKGYTLKNGQEINADSLFNYTQQADEKIIDQINNVDTDLQDTKTEIDSLKTEIAATKTLIGTKAQEVISAFETADNTIKLNIETLSGAVRDYVSESEAADRALTNKIGQLEEYVSNRDKTYYIPSTGLETLADIKTPYHGNYAIVTEVTDKGKSYKTAYIYDKTLNQGTGAWAALDGNYSATNVYFDEDLVVTDPIGVISQEEITEGKGFVKIAAEGVSVQTFFSSLMAKIKDPIITAPSLSFSLAKTSYSGEVGETYSLPKATATLDPGTYSYGTANAIGDTATGIIATNISIADNTTGGISNIKNANTGSYIPTGTQTYTESKVSTTYTAICEYPASELQPINNIQTSKNEKGQVYSKIAAGTITKTASCEATGYRYMFMGTVAEDPAEVNSDFIRELNKINKKAATGSQTFTAAAGQKSFYVAIPTSLTNKAPTFKYKFFGNWEALSGVEELSGTINVEGANGYEAKPYKVYKYTPLTNVFEAATEIQVTVN